MRETKDAAKYLTTQKTAPRQKLLVPKLEIPRLKNLDCRRKN